MRRPRIKHKEIDLEINIIDISEGIVRIEYYTIDGGFAKELSTPKKMFKRIAEIKAERNNLCIWDNGKATFPMKELPKSEQNKSNIHGGTVSKK